MPRPLDSLLDFAVVPGFTSAGYRLRRRGFAPTPDLTGRAFAVTGASSGLGMATCALLAEAGAAVHLVVRDRAKGEAARDRIGRDASGELFVWQCDVSRPASVREFAATFAAEVGALDALVHNAGVMPPERTHTPEGVELTFATNVVGPFLLTALLLPVLREGAPSRVVFVSSGGMYTAKLDGDDPQLRDRDFDPARFYAHTKRCEVVLAELWQLRLRGTGVSAHSMHPGWADTPGVQASLPTFRKVMRPILRDERQGADTIAWLCWAVEPVNDPGKFWHDRRSRPKHRVPWTREAGESRRRLWEECERLSGELVSPSPPGRRAGRGRP